MPGDKNFGDGISSKPEPKSGEKHPDTACRGKKVELTRELGPGFSATVEIKVDSRDPKEWGTQPISFWVTPLITQRKFNNLMELKQFADSMDGPLGELIRAAVREVGVS